MAEVIRMPRMSDTMEEGNIIAWLKNEGDKVEAGETLAEVETDKATMELDSYFDGVLLHIAVKEGTVPIDGVIAVIGKAGEDWQAAIAASGGGATAPAPVETPAAATAPPVATTTAPVAAPAAVSVPAADERVKASPLAKSIAKEANVDLASIKGSGDNGRIVKRDVEAAMAQPAPVAAPAAPAAVATAAAAFSPAGSGAYEDTPLSQMRKVIARRLGESKFSAPHFYLSVEIDMGKATALRQRINEFSPVKISFNDLVIKACAASLRQHPAINSSWMGIYSHQ
ncbi:MAG: dihydrolipoamide acetyltransferase family protein [Saprospiraceae bacterium]